MPPSRDAAAGGQRPKKARRVEPECRSGGVSKRARPRRGSHSLSHRRGVKRTRSPDKGANARQRRGRSANKQTRAPAPRSGEKNVKREPVNTKDTTKGRATSSSTRDHGGGAISTPLLSLRLAEFEQEGVTKWVRELRMLQERAPPGHHICLSKGAAAQAPEQKPKEEKVAAQAPKQKAAPKEDAPDDDYTYYSSSDSQQAADDERDGSGTSGEYSEVSAGGDADAADGKSS